MDQTNKSNTIMTPDKYAGIVTVFAVLLAVEYAGEAYDPWDILVGVLGLIIGWKYKCEAQSNEDSLFLWLTSFLLALGVLGVLSGVIGTTRQIYCSLVFVAKAPYWIELARFGFFAVLAVAFRLCLPVKKKAS